MTKIKVGVAEIKNGKRNNYDNCPIALAAMKAGLKNVIVTRGAILWNDKNGIPRTENLPAKVINIISHFDSTGKMEAFEFGV